MEGIQWPEEETGNDKATGVEFEDKNGRREELEGGTQYRNELENTKAPLDKLGG